MFTGHKSMKLIGLALFVMALATPPAFPKGNEVQFHGTVTKLDLGSATPSVTMRVEGFEVPVRVTADTEVEYLGDELQLSDIQINDFVKVSGFFANSGITADSITILDRGDGEFRLRGLITAVASVPAGTRITVLGIDVLVNSETKIERRGPSGGFTAANLAVNQNVDVRGFHQISEFIATRLKIGNREEDPIRVNFAGVITAVAPGRLTIDTQGGSSAIVLIGSTTVVTGTPEVGKFAEARGTLNSNLEVVATRVKIRQSKEDDDDDPPSRPQTKFEKKISLLPAGSASSVSGQAEAQLEQKGQETTQEFEVSFRRGLPNTDYAVKVEVAGAGSVSLATVRTNREGEGKLELKSPARSGQPNLAALLPAGKTVRDITKVQILNGATVVAEGTF
jgi:hypothetical protein